MPPPLVPQGLHELQTLAPACPSSLAGAGEPTLAFLYRFPHPTRLGRLSHTVPVAGGRRPKKPVSQAVRTGPASPTFHRTTVSAKAQARFGLETSSSCCHAFSRWARHRAFLQKSRPAAGFAKALPSLPLPQEGVTTSLIMAVRPMGTVFSLLAGTGRQLQMRLVDLRDTSI